MAPLYLTVHGKWPGFFRRPIKFPCARKVTLPNSISRMFQAASESCAFRRFLVSLCLVLSLQQECVCWLTELPMTGQDLHVAIARQDIAELQTVLATKCVTFTYCNFIHFWAPFEKRFAHMLSDRCLSVCMSVCVVCDVGVLWPNQRVVCIKMKLRMEVGFDPVHIVLDGDPAPGPLKGNSPQLSLQVCCG